MQNNFIFLKIIYLIHLYNAPSKNSCVFLVAQCSIQELWSAQLAGMFAVAVTPRHGDDGFAQNAAASGQRLVAGGGTGSQASVHSALP